MGIKTILIPIDGSSGNFSALSRAFIVADEFGAHIKAVHVMQRVTDSAAYGFYNLPNKLRKTVKSEAEKVAIEQASGLREQFEDFCKQYNVPLADRPSKKGGTSAIWHQEFGHVNEVLVRHGRMTDVIAVARPQIKKGTVRRSPIGETIEAILLETGRPVFLVPPKAKPKKCEHIAIGWNNSPEASRALAMTLPWMEQMGALTVIVSKERHENAKELVDYLSWHGVVADIVFLDKKQDSVGDAILKACSEVGAEIFVAGGFSHGRARELLFGGVTRYLLANSNIVTVMVH